MGKHGPCYHCGVTSTPLWRNGPPEKPVLCNACGSRWRTKGSLTNYTPLHARGPLEEEFRVSKEKNMVFKPKEQKLNKKKRSSDDVEGDCEMVDRDRNIHKGLDEDLSNRSSSGSAISCSESCAHFGSADVSDVTGSSQSNVWDSLVPSRKRTGGTRPKPSSVEKLTKDLHSILYQQSSYFSRTSEEELLYENGTPMGSVEIGNGSVLIRHLNLATLEEESEASSLPIENKSTCLGPSLPIHIQSKDPSCSSIGNDKLKRVEELQEHIRRDRLSQEKFQILRDRDLHLGSIDLKEIVSFEGFTKHLTCEEQEQLMKYLPSTDTEKPLESLEGMFASPQFGESFPYFQLLLREGVFDIPSGPNVNERRTLKRLVLRNLTKSTWVEYYRMLKDGKNKQNSGEKGDARGNGFPGGSNSTSLKRPRDSQNQNFPEPKVMMKSPRKIFKTGNVNLVSMKFPKPNPSTVGTKSANGTNDYGDDDSSCFSPRSLFAYPSERSSMLDSLQFTDDSPDQDLLLDVRSNSSFPEAELLSNVWKSKAAPNSYAESGLTEKGESLSCYPASSFSSKC